MTTTEIRKMYAKSVIRSLRFYYHKVIEVQFTFPLDWFNEQLREYASVEEWFSMKAPSVEETYHITIFTNPRKLMFFIKGYGKDIIMFLTEYDHIVDNIRISDTTPL